MLLAIFALFLVRFCCQELDFQQVQKIPEQSYVQVEGKIYKKELKKDKYLYYLKDVTIQSEEAIQSKDVIQSVIQLQRVCARLAEGHYQIGERISFQTKHRWMDKRRNTGAFDERQYYHSLGIATLYYVDGKITVLADRPAPVRNGLFLLRKQMRQVYITELNEKDAGILSSMVLGDKSLMEEELKGLYSIAGISHILAVSGLHVSMIGMTIFRLLRKSRRKYPFSCLVSGMCLFLFCLMSGMSISALRAGIMFIIYLGSQLLGRKYDSFRGMGIAAGVTLLWNPAALYNAGFWLSYLAVAGAVGIGRLPKEQGILKQPEGRVKTACASGLCSMWISCSILFTTLPVTAYFFYEIPMYSVLANLVILPLAGIVMGFGLIGGFLGLSGLPGMWVSFIPCHIVLRIYEGVCRLIQWLPAESLITGQPKLWMLFLYYGVLVASVCLIRKRVSARALFFPGIVTALLVIMLIIPNPKAFQVSYLDVGQGDGIYICTGDGRSFFIDGGSTSEESLGKYQVLPFLKSHGVRFLDGWIVTHADEDHVSGMVEAIESGYPVRQLLLSENIIQDEAYESLLVLAKEHGIQVIAVSNKDCIRGKNYELQFFTPESPNLDRNEASLVTEFSYKDDTFLFTGDIGEKQEKWLLSQLDMENNNSTLILKAAHHGSKYSNCQQFLQELSPDLVVISAGEHNLYGHPHQEAVERMEDVGSQMLVTMDTGEICIRERRGDLILTTLIENE